MQPWVSFIIPVLNEESLVAGLLRDLRRCYPGCQLIVVDGGSCDSTVAAALPLCDQLLLGERGRARQMNLGGRVAASPYLVFLHVDSYPSVARERLQEYLAKAPAWGFCRVALSGERGIFRVIEGCMNLRSTWTSVATGDQMLFVSRALFDATGGFDDIPLMEDVAYCKRLRRTAKPLVVHEPVITSSRRWDTGGVAATILRMWLLRLAYWIGVAPATLWRYYYGR